MKALKMKSLPLCIFFFFSLFLLNSCADSIDNLNSSFVKVKTNLLQSQNKAVYADSIDWENSSTVDMVDGKGQIVHNVALPWVQGISNGNIPSDWIDKNVNGVYSDRMYTKANYWELVYCNFEQSLPYKYLILYNKMSGILRCFFYTLADPSGEKTTNSMWGLCMNKTTSMFNYLHEYAYGADSTLNNPAYVSTLSGAFSDTTYQCSGYQNDVWYGIQMECAYDPNLYIGSNADFYIMGRGIDKITFSGTGNSVGNIEGNITNASSSSNGVSLNFSNFLNNSSTFSISNTNAVNSKVGSDIENGVNKGDSFFTSLWNNIKTNAASWVAGGIKSSIESIVSAGGSAIAKSIGGIIQFMVRE